MNQPKEQAKHSILHNYRNAFAACTYTATRNIEQSMKQRLQSLADATAVEEFCDVYGSGILIEDFENEVAELLGKEAAVFMPSGTMAQPIALRIWADRAKTNYIALPPSSHLNLHEHNSYQLLYGLKGINIGEDHLLPTLDDLKGAACDPLAAILLELPMREIGGQLPSWNELLEQSAWAKENNIKLHMDGARLWQCPPAYNKSLAQICSLFDSVYVSFYKDLGGIAGAILAGDKDFISSAKVWKKRCGGNLYALYPYLLAAREGLKTNLPDMHKRRNNALWFAAKLNTYPLFQTWPMVPQTNMFRLRINADPDNFLSKAAQWMAENKVALITVPYKIGEDYCLSEITIGNALEQKSQQEWGELLASFVDAVS